MVWFWVGWDGWMVGLQDEGFVCLGWENGVGLIIG